MERAERQLQAAKKEVADARAEAERQVQAARREAAEARAEVERAAVEKRALAVKAKQLESRLERAIDQGEPIGRVTILGFRSG